MSNVECIWDAGAELGEGVFWHEAEQALYWIDIMNSRLYRLGEGEKKASWDFDGRLSAAVPCREGGLVATFRDGLYHIVLNPPSKSLIAELENGLPDNRFNDACSDSLGQLWFGSMDDKQTSNTGSFYRMLSNGSIQVLDSFGKHCITNGPAMGADDRAVYFTDTIEKKIYCAPVDESGAPGNPELHIDFSSQPGYPDGMTSDSAGGLWVCQYGGARVTRFLPDGHENFSVVLPVPNVTKCAFGGKTMSTLFITTAASKKSTAEKKREPLSGNLFAVETGFSGSAMPPVSLPPRSDR